MKMKKILAISLICGIIVSCKKKTEDEVTPDLTPTTTGAAEDVYPDTVWTDNSTGPKLIFK
jgi:hypothetical protein